MANITGPNWPLLISMRKVIFILFIGFLFADYGGGYTGSGFRYGSNAREFSLAGAIVADKTPGFYAFSNPALLQYARSSQIGLSLQSMSLNRSIQTFSFVKNLPPSAGVGLALLRYGTNNISGRDYLNRETEQFSVYDTEGIMSFGVAFGRKLAVGINIKVVFSSLAPEIMDNYGGHQDGNSISWDFGVIYNINRRLILGGKFEDLNGSYTWKILNPCNDKERNYQDYAPKTIKLGIAYTQYKDIAIYFQEDIMISPDLVSGENSTNRNITFRSRLGVEYYFSKGVKFRGGLMQTRGSLASNEEKNGIYIKPSFGVGAPLKIWEKQYVQIDYALDLGSVGEGLSHLFSFSMELK